MWRIQHTFHIPVALRQLFDPTYTIEKAPHFSVEGHISFSDHTITFADTLCGFSEGVSERPFGQAIINGSYTNGTMDLYYQVLCHDISKALILLSNPHILGADLQGKGELKGHLTGTTKTFDLMDQKIIFDTNKISVCALTALNVTRTEKIPRITGTLTLESFKRPPLPKSSFVDKETLPVTAHQTAKNSDKTTQVTHQLSKQSKKETPMSFGCPIHGEMVFSIPPNNDIPQLNIQHLKAKVLFSPEYLKVIDLKGALATGSVEGSLQLTTQEKQNFIHLKGEDFLLGDIVNFLTRTETMKGGTTHMQLDLTAPQGSDLRKFLSTATGGFTLTTHQGALTLVQLRKVCRVLNFFKEASGLLHQREIFDNKVCNGTPLPLERIQLNFYVNKGVGKIETAVLRSTDLNGDFTGGVHFVDRSIQVKGMITIPKVPKVPITITGAIDDPAYDIDADDLTNHLVGTSFAGLLGIDGKKTFGNIIGKVANGFIPGIGNLVSLMTGGQGSVGSALGGLAGGLLGGPIGAIALGGLFGTAQKKVTKKDVKKKKPNDKEVNNDP